MEKFNFIYKNIEISGNCSDENIHINDSYRIGRKEDMKNVLRIILDTTPNHYARVYTPFIREWRAHNLLYMLGIQKERTKDVDLDSGETTLRKIGYIILSALYTFFPKPQLTENK